VSKEKILIFGDGQIGNFYHNFFVSEKIPSLVTPADILKSAEIAKAIDDYQPTVVINTAAQTNLEWCISNKLEAFNINVLGADNVARACDQRHLYFIHFSSGCIMESRDENDARKETDLPHPISYYSWTKVWSENLIGFNKSPDFKYLILRPRQPVSAQINYKNMLLKLLTFTKFIDTPNSGTVIEDLMEWTLLMIQKRVTGVYNVANSGWTTPYQIGLLLKKHILPSLPVNKITKEELNQLTPEKRVGTILDVTKLESLVGEVKPYKQRLEEIIIQLGSNFKSGDKKFILDQLKLTVEQSKTRTIVNDVWRELIPVNP
jgi:dTDP-4-dehydrorhamnose reductase